MNNKIHTNVYENFSATQQWERLAPSFGVKGALKKFLPGISFEKFFLCISPLKCLESRWLFIEHFQRCIFIEVLKILFCNSLMLSYCITKSSSHLFLHGLKGSDCAVGFTGVLAEPTLFLQNQSKIDGLVMQGIMVMYCFYREAA